MTHDCGTLRCRAGQGALGFHHVPGTLEIEADMEARHERSTWT
jgi:hypothetical protein